MRRAPNEITFQTIINCRESFVLTYVSWNATYLEPSYFYCTHFTIIKITVYCRRLYQFNFSYRACERYTLVSESTLDWTNLLLESNRCSIKICSCWKSWWIFMCLKIVTQQYREGIGRAIKTIRGCWKHGHTSAAGHGDRQYYIKGCLAARIQNVLVGIVGGLPTGGNLLMGCLNYRHLL